jgi:hypothetical protein
MTKNALLLAILSGFLLSVFRPDFPLDVNFFKQAYLSYHLNCIPVNLYLPPST